MYQISVKEYKRIDCSDDIRLEVIRNKSNKIPVMNIVTLPGK
jgi:hypothetical protein